MPKLPLHQDCCGCTACESICSHNAITMRADDEGFLHPHIDNEICVDCKLCEKVCPVLVRDATERVKSYKEIYAGRLKDAKLLHLSSSGGAFYALAKATIEEGGVVLGAEYNSDCEVVHGVATTLEECAKFRGSKYVQSSITGIYSKVKDYLKEDRYVLFTGTPCQVAGLQLYLRRDYDKLITMDLVCHAAPSPLIFKDYKNFVEKKLNKKILAINMRDKEVREWLEPFSNRFLFEYGDEIVDPKGIIGWNNIFFTKLIDRPSCHRCRFANFDRAGDITVADFWDYENKRPDLRDNRGTSLVIVNTEKGCGFLSKTKNDFEIFPITEDEARQRNLVTPTTEGKDRNVFWVYYHKHGFEKSYKKYFVPGFKVWCKGIIIVILKKLHII